MAVLLLVLAASPASAKTELYGPAHRPWMDRCVEKSRVATPDLRLQVFESDITGRSYIAPWDLEVYLDDPRDSRVDCQVLMHEIGHLYDWALLSPSSRHYLGCRLLGFRSPLGWWSHTGPDGRRVNGSESRPGPLEWFAELYSVAALSGRDVPRGRDWMDRLSEVSDLDYGYAFYDVKPSRRAFIKARRYLNWLPVQSRPEIAQGPRQLHPFSC